VRSLVFLYVFAVCVVCDFVLRGCGWLCGLNLCGVCV